MAQPPARPLLFPHPHPLHSVVSFPSLHCRDQRQPSYRHITIIIVSLAASALARCCQRQLGFLVEMFSRRKHVCVTVLQTGLSHACASGFMPILELLSTVSDDVDPNLADNDGNTPLIFAAQAGRC